MKLPKIFIPEKGLEDKTNKLLTEKPLALERQNINFDGLEIEKMYDRCFYYFEASLKRLKEAGYDRHLYPWEYFSLLIGHFEGGINKKSDSIAKEMLYSLGGWFSMAVERRDDDSIVCYADPQNLRWDDVALNYTIDGGLVRYRERKEFDVTGIPSDEWVNLADFKDDFVEYFYSRKFKNLPIELQRNAQVLLPLPYHNPIHPVGTTNHYGECMVLYCHDRIGHSRGVRKASSHKRGRL